MRELSILVCLIIVHPNMNRLLLLVVHCFPKPAPNPLQLVPAYKQMYVLEVDRIGHKSNNGTPILAPPLHDSVVK